MPKDPKDIFLKEARKIIIAIHNTSIRGKLLTTKHLKQIQDFLEKTADA